LQAETLEGPGRSHVVSERRHSVCYWPEISVAGFTLETFYQADPDTAANISRRWLQPCQDGRRSWIERDALNLGDPSSARFRPRHVHQNAELLANCQQAYCTGTGIAGRTAENSLMKPRGGS
jgi:hypothetical protein